MYQMQPNQNYYPGPQVNAVKIDIINPQAYGQGQQPQGMMPYPQEQYHYGVPQTQMYGMPAQSMYNQYPQYPQPQMMPPANNYYLPPAATQPPVYTEPSVAQAPQVVTSPITSAQVPPPVINQNNNPVVNTPPVIPVPNVEVPKAPESVIAEPQQKAPVQAETEAQAPLAPERAPAPEPMESKPTPQIAVDVAGINAGLKSTDLEKQFEAIQKIAEVEQNSPDQAAALLTEETFTSLGDILTKDNSSLAGPTQEQLTLREKLQTGEKLSPEEQAKAEELSPREIAEMNKQYATYSSAVLLKEFREEVAKDPEIDVVKLGDLPLVNIMVQNLKTNGNPLIREASISALNYLGKAEDKETLNTLFKIAAEQDQDEYVVAAANEGLANADKLVA